MITPARSSLTTSPLAATATRRWYRPRGGSTARWRLLASLWLGGLALAVAAEPAPAPLVPQGEAVADAQAWLAAVPRNADADCMAFSPDGRLLAAGGQIWDLASGTLVQELAGVQPVDCAIAFNPDGRTLAGFADDGALRLWDLASGAPVRTLVRNGYGYAGPVAFSPDGRTLAARSRPLLILILDAENGAVVRTLKLHGDPVASVASVAFSPDGRTLASGSVGNRVRLWDTASRLPIRTLEDERTSGGGVPVFAFSPDGRTLAIGQVTGGVRFWDPVRGVPLRTQQGTSIVASLTFSPDGQTLAGGLDGGSVGLWDVASGAPVRTLEWLTAVHYNGHSAQERRWNINEYYAPVAYVHSTGGMDAVQSLAFSPDGRLLAVGYRRIGLRLWDPGSGNPLPSPAGYEWTTLFTAVAFSRDGRTLAGADERTVRLWDPAQGTEVRRLEGHADTVRAVAFSPDGRRLASGARDRTVRLWDPASGALLRTLEGHGAAVQGVAFSPDGQTLASGSDDGTVRLWDPLSGRLIGLLRYADDFWVSCRIGAGGDRCWRYDDGTLVLGRDAQGRLQPRSLPPRREPVKLEVGIGTDQATSAPLQVIAGALAQFQIRIRNTGAEPVYWLRLVPRLVPTGAAAAPFLFYPPTRLIKLDPGAEQTLTGKVSFAAGAGKETPVAATLDLALEMDQGEPIPIRVRVQGLVPEPKAVSGPGLNAAGQR